MIQLVYVSQASDAFSAGHLPGMLETSRKNNAQINVTGMLAYNSGSFIQVLEGEEGAVRQLVQRIEKDFRHTACRILTENAIDRREFGLWQMAFIDTEGRFATHDQYLNAGIMDFSADIERYGKDATRARRLLQMFSEGSWRQTA